MVHFIYDGKSFTKLSDSRLIGSVMEFEGIFETMGVFNKEIFLLDEHLKRFYLGVERTGINVFPLAQLTNAIHELVESHGKARIIRFIAAKGLDFKMIFSISTISRYEKGHYKKGFRLGIAGIGGEDPFTTDSSIKYLSLMKLSKFRELAGKKNLNDCLILKNGFISDTSVANVFWAKDNTIFTPSPEKCLLTGVTRNFVIKSLSENGIRVEQGGFELEEILDADEVFITNSLMGVMPVTMIALTSGDLLKFEVGEKTKYLIFVGSGLES